MFYEALIEVTIVLCQHPEKAMVYFTLAVISGFLISSTCLCGHWVALKLAPVTSSRPPRPVRPMLISNTVPVYPSYRSSSIPPLPRTYPPMSKTKYSRLSKRPLPPQPGLMRSQSYVNTPKATIERIPDPENISWSSQRFAPAISVPDYLDHLDQEEESYDDEAGFLYFNNNPVADNQRRFSWVYVRETLV